MGLPASTNAAERIINTALRNIAQPLMNSLLPLPQPGSPIATRELLAQQSIDRLANEVGNGRIPVGG
ncbi:MAG TPA: hypothetical protein VMF11_13405 [Candidatus Baltobacteraceae bacterium]|nr:hypothetical protein [Candidatus Baltobacteraceae bacterium]